MKKDPKTSSLWFMSLKTTSEYRRVSCEKRGIFQKTPHT